MKNMMMFVLFYFGLGCCFCGLGVLVWMFLADLGCSWVLVVLGRKGWWLETFRNGTILRRFFISGRDKLEQILEKPFAPLV